MHVEHLWYELSSVSQEFCNGDDLIAGVDVASNSVVHLTVLDDHRSQELSSVSHKFDHVDD